MSHGPFALLLACATLLPLVLAVWVPETATTAPDSPSLWVDEFEDGAFGLSPPPTGTLPARSLTEVRVTPLPPRFSARFRVAFIGGGTSDPEGLPASRLAFDRNIGDTQ